MTKRLWGALFVAALASLSGLCTIVALDVVPDEKIWGFGFLVTTMILGLILWIVLTHRK